MVRQKFSNSWKGSKQARKKRKFIANAPLHIKRKFLSATLSKPLRKQYSRRSIELRKGDEVKVMRGNFAGKTGKISVAQTNKMRVAVEGLQRQKRDGTKVNVWFNASKLMITSLNTDDKMRLKSREKKVEAKKEINKETKANAPNKK